MTAEAPVRVCLCITGWHFPEPFFRQLKDLPGCHAYVVAHVPRARIPAYVAETIGSERLLERPNRGYDWGCYQQFLESGLWRSYDYIFFMHDDVTIKDSGFVVAVQALLANHTVVGNGRLAMPPNYPMLSEESYAHAAWKPPSRHFTHRAVRGSFFATTRRGLEILERFEVYWDRFRVSPGSGNWSTKASCAKWEHRCGASCFGYLSDRQEESQYLLEHVRGTAHDNRERPRRGDAFRHLFWNRMVAGSAKRYMQTLWGEHGGWRAAWCRLFMPFFIALVSGCPLRDIRTSPADT